MFPLSFTIKETEFFDERRNEFITYPQVTLKMENSLVAISKWESEYHKSFFKKGDKTNEEILRYMYYMVYSPENLDYDYFLNVILANRNIYEKIVSYISDKMTATNFREDPNEPKSNEVVTSELIYFQMIQYGIPSEYEHWHINRLLTLIKVCAIKNSPPKKRSMQSIMRDNNALNEARRKALNTRG